MSIEDYVDWADLYIDWPNFYQYRKDMLEDLKKWYKRFCINCWADMNISQKNKCYCSRKCWLEDEDQIYCNINYYIEKKILYDNY